MSKVKNLEGMEIVVIEDPNPSRVQFEAFARIMIRKLEKLVQDPEWVKGFEAWKAEKESEKINSTQVDENIKEK